MLVEVLRRGALRATLGLTGLECRAQLAQLIGHALVLGACLVERACHVADVLVRLADLPLGVGASCGGGFFGERCAPNGLGALALGRRDAVVEAGRLGLVRLVEHYEAQEVLDIYDALERAIGGTADLRRLTLLRERLQS